MATSSGGNLHTVRRMMRRREPRQSSRQEVGGPDFRIRRLTAAVRAIGRRP